MNEDNGYLKARSIRKRLEVQAVLELTSPAHIGGESFLNLSDQPILVDQDGRPYLPGTTIAGLLRHHLHKLQHIDYSQSYQDEESNKIAELFGARWNKDDDDQSALIVDDAPMDHSQTGKRELRDGVAICHSTGTAIPGKKFDQEWLPVGTRFLVSFELLLNEDDARNTKRLQGFLTVLQALEKGQIRLGARTSRGYGRCAARDFSYRLFETQTLSGLLQWLGSGGGGPEDWPELEWFRIGSVQKLSQEVSDHTGLEVLLDEESPVIPRLRIELSLSCPGSMIIRSSGNQPEDADAIHLHRLHQDTQEKIPIIPGSSLAGVLRHRALKISKTVSGKNGDSEAEDMIDGLFGPEVREGRPSQASRVQVEEAVLQGSPEILRHARTMIDRWRGSAFEHHLFDEDVLFGSTVTLTWEVANPIPNEAEIGLMLCLVKDLFTGDLPVGGESGIGRGFLYGCHGDIKLQGQVKKPGSSDDVSLRIQLSGDARGSIEVAGDAPTETSKYFSALKTQLQGGAA